MQPSVSLENITKKYRLGEVGTGSLSHDLNRIWHRFRGHDDPYTKVDYISSNSDRDKSTTINALCDVSFEVGEGEVLGIIGNNGAGKSTLLKILSRITTQTHGVVKIRGRIASLLEVGTGFHPELTGRENIFLNGAILGMRRSEIRSKLDEIVDFSGCVRYIDTPVKRYSSGMYVRLAFAVAAHLEPEILIIDEVLAVGDLEFQKKCLGKMKDVASNGRTVIFVSHNMAAVSTLCHTAIWLQRGKLLRSGKTCDVVSAYTEHTVGSIESVVNIENKARSGSGIARFTELSIHSAKKGCSLYQKIIPGSDVDIQLKILSIASITDVNVAITLYDLNGIRIVDVNTALKGHVLSLPINSSAIVKFTLKSLLLKPGKYVVDLWMGKGGIEDIDYIREAGVIEVKFDHTRSNHTETFPGIYQCEFSHQIIKNYDF